MEAKINVTDEFVKNSIRVLNIERNRENNIRSVLEFYRALSVMPSPEGEMIKLFDGLETVKILIEETSVDAHYNCKVMASIEDNFERYFAETRYPSEKQKKIFQNYIAEKTSAMEDEVELMQDMSRLKNHAMQNPMVLYFYTYK